MQIWNLASVRTIFTGVLQELKERDLLHQNVIKIPPFSPQQFVLQRLAYFGKYNNHKTRKLFGQKLFYNEFLCHQWIALQHSCLHHPIKKPSQNQSSLDTKQHSKCSPVQLTFSVKPHPLFVAVAFVPVDVWETQHHRRHYCCTRVPPALSFSPSNRIPYLCKDTSQSK